MPPNKIVRLSVKLIGGEWKLDDGRTIDLPEGTAGELRVARGGFANVEFLARLTVKREVVALRAGTELRVALTIREELDNALLPFLRATPHDASEKISVATQFVSVWLSKHPGTQGLSAVGIGGLRVCFAGTAMRGIKSGAVELPKIHGLEPAESLNHAFTCLSEVFEPWRKAHTGSIYQRVFYEECNGRWHPLGDFRNRALATERRPLIKRLWSSVAT